MRKHTESKYPLKPVPDHVRKMRDKRFVGWDENGPCKYRYLYVPNRLKYSVYLNKYDYGIRQKSTKIKQDLWIHGKCIFIKG